MEGYAKSSIGDIEKGHRLRIEITDALLQIDEIEGETAGDDRRQRERTCVYQGGRPGNKQGHDHPGRERSRASAPALLIFVF